jgi:hypothetical protein
MGTNSLQFWHTFFPLFPFIGDDGSGSYSLSFAFSLIFSFSFDYLSTALVFLALEFFAFWVGGDLLTGLVFGVGGFLIDLDCLSMLC